MIQNDGRKKKKKNLNYHHPQRFKLIKRSREDAWNYKYEAKKIYRKKKTENKKNIAKSIDFNILSLVLYRLVMSESVQFNHSQQNPMYIYYLNFEYAYDFILISISKLEREVTEKGLV